ncbi:MAG: Ig-like domain-containing protein, partial [Terracidiphilus sp.]
CTVATSALALGSHTISAAYSGNSTYSSSTGSLSSNQVVNAAATSLALSASPNPSTVNQTVAFTATLTFPSGSTALTGSVAFTDNGTSIGGCSAITPSVGGTAICNDSALTASATAHVIKATFTDSKGNFATSPATLAGGQTVSAATGTITLGASPNPSTYHQNVIFTATVSIPAGGITPSGTVAFTDSVTTAAIPGCSAQTLNSNNVAQCSTTVLANGVHTITASYGGDSNFNVSSGNVSQTVNSATTSVNISSSLNPSVFGNSVTFLATVSSTLQGTTPFNGNMSFQDNGVAIGGCTSLPVNGTSGQAQCPTSSLTVGSDTITAIYAGDTNFGGASNTLVQKVTTNGSSSLTLTSSSSGSVEAGTMVTYTAAITPAYTGAIPLSGSMVFTDTYVNPPSSTTIQLCSVAAGSANFTAAGVATCKYMLPDGTNSVSASYVSDPNVSATPSSSLSLLVEDFSLAITPIPSSAFVVTQGTGTALDPDPYPAQAISVTPASISGYIGNLTLSCAALPSSGAPACDLASKTLTVGTGTQTSVGITLDATSAKPGTYMFTVTGTDANNVIRTVTFPVMVRSASAPLTVVSGATTGNTATIQFVVPANISLPATGTTFACLSVVGPELGTTYTPSKLSIGCSFNPATIPTSASAQTATVTVTVSTGGTVAMNQPAGQPNNRSNSLLVAGVFGIPVFGLLGLLGGRKSTRTIFLRLLAIVAICLAGWQVMGCGGSFHGSSTTSGGLTPPGVYNILVQGTGSDGNTYQAVIKLNVTL